MAKVKVISVSMKDVKVIEKRADRLSKSIGKLAERVSKINDAKLSAKALKVLGDSEEFFMVLTAALTPSVVDDE